MKYILFIFFLLSVIKGNCQVLPPDRTDTYYAQLWNIYDSHKRISHISFPIMKVNGITALPLLFEGVISPYFIFYRGRDRARRQLRSFEFHFNPEFVLRMYAQEPIGSPTKSLPVLPMNFNPELSVVKFFHRNFNDPMPKQEVNKYLFAEFLIAHYSNGQESPHFLPDTVNINNDSIPNYAGGNFSTNFWRLSVTGGFFDNKNNIYSITPFIQNDGGIGSVFSYDDAQIRSYGKWRLGSILQFQSTKICMFKRRTKVLSRPIGQFSSVQEKRLKEYYATFMLRYKPEIIIDNLDNYPSDSKLRMSHRLSIVWHPLNWRNLGVLLEYYHGRDFYNIRFYDKISQLKLGLVANHCFYSPK